LWVTSIQVALVPSHQLIWCQEEKQFVVLLKYIMSEKEEFIKAQVKDNKVVVYSKTRCPFCKKAKDALKAAGLKDYLLIELDERDDGDEFQDALQKITGGRSVPRVFIGGTFVGGGDDVQVLQNKGQLKPKLENAGAL
ncbi:unnamed protein product, partial [Pocillopora meandrina]